MRVETAAEENERTTCINTRAHTQLYTLAKNPPAANKVEYDYLGL